MNENNRGFTALELMFEVARMTNKTEELLDELFQPECDLSRFKTKKERTRYETKLQGMRKSFGTKNGVQQIKFIDDTTSIEKYDYDLNDSESKRAFENTLIKLPKIGGNFDAKISRYQFRTKFRGYLQASGLNIIDRGENGGWYYPIVVEMMEIYKKNSVHSVPKALKLSYQFLSEKYNSPARVFKIFYKNLLSLNSSIRHK